MINNKWIFQVILVMIIQTAATFGIYTWMDQFLYYEFFVKVSIFYISISFWLSALIFYKDSQDDFYTDNPVKAFFNPLMVASIILFVESMIYYWIQ